jgi:hypothetical protein
VISSENGNLQPVLSGVLIVVFTYISNYSERLSKQASKQHIAAGARLGGPSEISQNHHKGGRKSHLAPVPGLWRVIHAGVQIDSMMAPCPAAR